MSAKRAFGICSAIIAAGCLAIESNAQPQYNAYPYDVSNVPGSSIAHAYYTFSDDVDFKGQEERLSRGKKKQGAKIEQIDFAISLPMLRGYNASVLVGVDYRYNSFEFHELDISKQELHALQVPFDFIWSVNPQFKVSLRAAPALYSDLQEVGTDDFFIGGNLVMYYDATPNLTWAGGVAFDREFGNEALYPVLGFNYNWGEQWQFRLIFPRPKITFAPNENFNIFVYAEPGGGKWDASPEMSEQRTSFEYENLAAGVGAELRIPGSPAFIHLSAGINFNRSVGTGVDDIDFQDADLEDAFFVRTGLAVRY